MQAQGGLPQKTPEESVSEEEPESVSEEEGLTQARPQRAIAVDARDRLAASAILETDP